MTAEQLYELMVVGFEHPVEDGSGRERMIMNVLESALKEEYDRGYGDGEDKWRYS